jgi:hypothetical protein
VHAVAFDETHENNGKPFQCYDMSYRVRAVSQCCTFPTHPLYNGKPFQCYGMSYRVRAVSQCCKFPTHTKSALYNVVGATTDAGAFYKVYYKFSPYNNTK